MARRAPIRQPCCSSRRKQSDFKLDQRAQRELVHSSTPPSKPRLRQCRMPSFRNRADKPVHFAGATDARGPECKSSDTDLGHHPVQNGISLVRSPESPVQRQPEELVKRLEQLHLLNLGDSHAGFSGCSSPARTGGQYADGTARFPLCHIRPPACLRLHPCGLA